MANGVCRSIAISLVALFISACGGGGGGSSAAATATQRVVNISWAANREAAVNSLGGGYTVAISGQTPINVPYVSGVAAPTTVAASLASGNYSATVTAYSALNPPGGSSGSKSLPSTTIAFVVP